jgi:cob(I)alamin adenosyltransferase
MKAAVYTRTGDKGQTSLLSGERVSKTSLRVEAYGTIDETTSALGLARTMVERQDVKDTILKIQQLLMSVMADVASLNLSESERYIKFEHVKMMEEIIDKFDAQLAPLTHFIIPGESKRTAGLDIARTTARRAERALLRVAEKEELNKNVLLFMNRLSDMCFILARAENEIHDEK